MALGFWYVTWILQVMVTSLVGVSFTLEVTFDIYIPLSCNSALSDTYSVTIADTLQHIKESESYRDLEITETAYDSCEETVVLDVLVSRISDTSIANHITLGPGVHALCEPLARLAHYYNKTIISAQCTQKELSIFSDYGYFMRSVPSTASLSQAISKLLRHFLWKRIAFITSTSHECWTFAKDVYYGITTDEFIVENVIEIDGDFDAAAVRRQLQTIHTSTRGILLCLEDSHIDDVMQLVDDVELGDGEHALFLIRAQRSLDASEDGITGASWLSGNNVTLSDSLLRSLLFIQAHPFPLSAYETQFYNSSLGNIRSANVDENLFNALSISASVSQNFSTTTPNSKLTASAFYAHAQNMQFVGLYDNLTLSNEASLDFYYSVWDYDLDSDTFQSVMHLDSVLSSWEEVHSIDWIGGEQPPNDYCDFYNCEDEDSSLSVGATIGIVLSAACLVAVTVVAAYFFRRKLLLKEMERGPNKIILVEGDLVFVTPKSISKSMKSLRPSHDKPDLLKSHQSSFLEEPSEFSMSHSSFPDFMESGDTARYNGDMVYLKQMLIKGFEMKSKVRSYLKIMREMRHENVNPFVGCYNDPFKASLVFEYCTRCSLEDLIANEQIKLDWDFKLSLLTDLVKGMKYLSNSPIKYHGRLKSGNCVVDSRFVLKITDYGVTSLYEKYQTRRQYSAKELLWTAPELIRDEELLYRGSQKGDVFSFAIIMQEVIVRGHPYCMMEIGATDIIKKVRKPPPLCRPSVSQGAAPPQYIQMMKQCWAEMPDMRPDFDMIYKQFKDITKGKKHNIVDAMFKKLEKYSSDLEAMIAERTGQFEEEKKKVENLLTQMLPSTVAHALIRGEPVDPESFDEVTIYFSDIVGFTTISAMSTPIQVVELLNDLYTMFDSTIDDYDVYKVETIGDAYMVCSGLPLRNENRHAGEISAMSLDLLSKCGQFEIRHMPEVPLRLRIGLHTGPCVAGVVGLRMPRYCLFGDTVNTASRMESTGSAFRIHVSPMTKDVLDELGGYKLDYRGETELKGKGMVKSYWLVGKDGFSKPLPQPPPLTSGDNHGLASVLDKKKLEAQSNSQQKAATKPPKLGELKKTNSGNNNTSPTQPTNNNTSPKQTTNDNTSPKQTTNSNTSPKQTNNSQILSLQKPSSIDETAKSTDTTDITDTTGNMKTTEKRTLPQTQESESQVQNAAPSNKQNGEVLKTRVSPHKRHARESRESLVTNTSDRSDLSITPIRIEEKTRGSLSKS